MFPRLLFLVSLMLFSAWVNSALLPHHEMHISIEPEHSRLTVRDTLTLPSKAKTWDFALNAHIELSDHPHITEISGLNWGDIKLRHYRVQTQGQAAIELNYSGELPYQQPSAEGIGKEHVGLSLRQVWFPIGHDARWTYTLDVELPEGWLAINGGASNQAHRFVMDMPQDDIHLIAGPYTVATQQVKDGLVAEVYLHQADPALSQRLLTTASRYLTLYSELLGPYPYRRFSMVENKIETGYAMPGFTLLGPRVMRFPFILHSSLPHEILHNWWGNGVYTDYPKGNWNEGLTAYLADYAIKEQRNQGAEYRFDALLKFADYVSKERDFPLKDFRSRHNQASMAVGYSKALMVQHMLRRQLGDKAYIDGLRRFYREHTHQHATFDNLARSFDAPWIEAYFEQWLTRTGAPTLAIENVQYSAGRLQFDLRQTQAADVFELRIPIRILTQTGDRWHHVNMSQRQQSVAIDLEHEPMEVAVDPAFDVFRTLYAEERPSTLGAVFGTQPLLLVLPSSGPKAEQQAWTQLARQWTRRYPQAQVLTDSALNELPEEGGLWVLGRHNRLLSLLPKPLSVTHQGKGIDTDRLSLINTGRADALHWGSISSPSVQAISALARKLPHYSKYSYLAFEGEKATNRIKGRHPRTQSPLIVDLKPSFSPSSTPHQEPALLNLATPSL